MWLKVNSLCIVCPAFGWQSSCTAPTSKDSWDRLQHARDPRGYKRFGWIDEPVHETKQERYQHKETEREEWRLTTRHTVRWAVLCLPQNSPFWNYAQKVHSWFRQNITHFHIREKASKKISTLFLIHRRHFKWQKVCADSHWTWI